LRARLGEPIAEHKALHAKLNGAFAKQKALRATPKGLRARLFAKMPRKIA